MWSPKTIKKNPAAYRRVLAGFCRNCGKPRNHYKVYCDDCSVRTREASRLRTGCRPRVKGGGGRPTKDSSEQ
jgi:hypothetical protein